MYRRDAPKEALLPKATPSKSLVPSGVIPPLETLCVPKLSGAFGTQF